MDEYEKQARELLEEVLISHGRGHYTTAADEAAVRNLIPKLRAAAEQARAEEREACANMADCFYTSSVAAAIRDRIRARGVKP